ncbi:MAG TPA: IS5 family transposase [Bacillus sp. (in: firmicutes)]|nr:IS5 family transposase [Bacillus sp. (in: firmicutes)]
MIHWPSYNQSLVRRGEILFAYDFLDIWDDDLAKMNENKKGKKYKFPDSFILVIGHIRVYFHIPYRQTEGIIKATGKCLPDHPSYSQICRRVNKLDITTSNRSDDDDDDGNIIIAIDSTGIKITNRGQWMQDKWQQIRNKKGYLKIHVAVNIKTKEILALEVTGEKVHDGQIMPKLIEHVLENNNDIKINSALGDGSYDGNENFKYLQKKKIMPGIKVRKNSIVSLKNNSLRNREAKFQTRDFIKWKKKRKYGSRWIAETVFSSIKRMFGEHASATKFQNMVKEMILKVSLYNLFRRLA